MLWTDITSYDLLSQHCLLCVVAGTKLSKSLFSSSQSPVMVSDNNCSSVELDQLHTEEDKVILFYFFYVLNHNAVIYYLDCLSNICHTISCKMF